MSLTLGIDVGTSGVRSAVIDESGLPVSTARAAHLPQNPDQIDAAKWWEAVRNCLRTQVSNLTAAGLASREITRLAVDGTSGSMVLTDAKLAPVTRALMYNSKGFEREAAEIATLAEDPSIVRGSNSALARAMHLASETVSEPAHLLHQADFIAAKFMAKGGLSDENNALKTGFDPGQQAWPHWINKLFNQELLPDVRPVGTPLGAIDPKIASEFDLSKDLVIHAGTTDSIAAFLAAAPLELGTAVTSLGSTIAVKVLSSKRIEAPEYGLYSHRLTLGKLGDAWLVGGASNSGGAVLAAHFSTDELVALSERIDPTTPSGLDYYPLSAPGERFPTNDPTLQPRLTPVPEDRARYLQGMLEGMARIEARCYQLIQELGGGSPTQLFTAGGGARNSAWTDIRQRALGLTISPACHSEASIGVARLAQSH